MLLPMRKRGAVVVVAAFVAGIAGVIVGLTSASATTHLWPAIAPAPAAGYCDPSSSSTVTVIIWADMTKDRCYSVTSAQHLRLVNHSGRTVRMRAPFLRGVVLARGASRVFPAHFGSYLMPGDHKIGSSLWCCFSADLFLQGAPAPTSTAPVG